MCDCNVVWKCVCDCWHCTHSMHSTHTHTRLTAFCPGLPVWAGARKVKPIWILLKQEAVSGSGISWAVCKSAPRSRQITTPVPHRSVFYRPDALPAAQPTASKHWRQSMHCRFCEMVEHPSVCPIDRQLHLVGLLLSALQAGWLVGWSRYWLTVCAGAQQQMQAVSCWQPRAAADHKQELL